MPVDPLDNAAALALVELGLHMNPTYALWSLCMEKRACDKAAIYNCVKCKQGLFMVHVLNDVLQSKSPTF